MDTIYNFIKNPINLLSKYTNTEGDTVFSVLCVPCFIIPNTDDKNTLLGEKIEMKLDIHDTLNHLGPEISIVHENRYNNQFTQQHRELEELIQYSNKSTVPLSFLDRL